MAISLVLFSSVVAVVRKSPGSAFAQLWIVVGESSGEEKRMVRITASPAITTSATTSSLIRS